MLLKEIRAIVAELRQMLQQSRNVVLLKATNV